MCTPELDLAHAGDSICQNHPLPVPMKFTCYQAPNQRAQAPQAACGICIIKHTLLHATWTKFPDRVYLKVLSLSTI